MSPNGTKCPACAAETGVDQSLRIRGLVREVHRCPRCGAFHFPNPDWLPAVYAEPISVLDIGLAGRCVNYARTAEAIIRAEKLQGVAHLDYGGGYGLLTRLLRDRGLDMRHFEPYTANLFAQGFEGRPEDHYGVVTAIEVLEHLTEPDRMLYEVQDGTQMVLISTVLVPPGMTDLRDWWYVGENGQHVTFYTEESLRLLANRHGYQLTSNGSSVHLMHRRALRPLTRAIMRDVRTSVVLARTLRYAQRSRSLRDADGAQVMDIYLGGDPFQDG